MREDWYSTEKMRIIISVLIALAVIAIAVKYRDNIVTAIKEIRLEWVFLGYFFYLMTYIFRAFRLKTLLNNRIGFWPDCIYCASLHGFATYMLPMRAGDLALPFLLKTISRIEVSKGVTILYKARLLDVFTLGIWTFLAAVYPYWTIPSYVRGSLCVLGGMMMVAPFFLRKLFLFSASFEGYVGRFTRKLSRVGPLHMKEIIQTAVIWSALAASFYCIAEAIGLSLQLGAVWLLIVIQMPLQLIPLQGLGNSGNHEGGWVAGLTLLGYSTATAFEFALMSHAVLLLYVLLMGPIALISGIFCRDQKSLDDSK